MSISNQPLPAPVGYMPYHDIGSRRNIIVDGKSRENTVLTLSHWPWNQTPAALLRDTSTETVLAYLRSPAAHVQADCVSNSHYDEDGLLGIFALQNPELALVYRELLADTSRAGDFCVYHDRQAARLAFALGSFADAETSPLPADVFSGKLRGRITRIYQEMLPRVAGMLSDIEALRPFWQQEDAHLDDSEARIGSGEISLDEYPEFDLAVVRIPALMRAQVVRRYVRQWQRPVHPFAVCSLTDCNRLVWLQGQTMEFQYRYESWVQLASRRPSLRIDLAGLALRLTDLETKGAVWRFEGVNDVAPRLFIPAGQPSDLHPDRFLSELFAWLGSRPAAWDPYSPPLEGCQ